MKCRAVDWSEIQNKRLSKWKKSVLKCLIFFEKEYFFIEKVRNYV